MMSYIIANWKSNKTQKDVEEWITFVGSQSVIDTDTCKIIVCAPYLYLPYLSEYISSHSLPMLLGAQNCSEYESGAYTGEITAEMIAQYAQYVIIGHSERRTLYHENDAQLFQKNLRAKAAGLHTIFCVPNTETTIPSDADIAAYEPVWAIGTGKAETPQNANEAIQQIKKRWNVSTVIYGGSVTPENMDEFLSQTDISGVLPGKASLNPQGFIQLLQSVRTMSS